MGVWVCVGGGCESVCVRECVCMCVCVCVQCTVHVHVREM